MFFIQGKYNHFFHYTKPICLLHNDLHIQNIIKRPINLGFGAISLFYKIFQSFFIKLRTKKIKSKNSSQKSSP